MLTKHMTNYLVDSLLLGSLCILRCKMYFYCKSLNSEKNCQIKKQLFDARVSEEKKHPQTTKRNPVRMEWSCFNNFLKGAILSWESSILLAIVPYCKETRSYEIPLRPKAQKGKVSLALLRHKHKCIVITVTIRISFTFQFHVLLALVLKENLNLCLYFELVSFYSRPWSINVLCLVNRLFTWEYSETWMLWFAFRTFQPRRMSCLLFAC